MDKKPMDSFAHRLRMALDERRMSQTYLCQLTKTPKSSMSQYLSGRNLPKTDRVYKYSEVLMVNPTWLLGYDVPMKREETPVNKTVSGISYGSDFNIELIENNLNKASTEQLKRLVAYANYLLVKKESEE